MVKTTAPCFSEIELRSIADAIVEATSHAYLNILFRQIGCPEPVREGPRWLRICNVLGAAQSKTQTGNLIMKFISETLHPQRFVSDPASHERYIEAVNRILAFKGSQIRPDGKFQAISAATTVDEARGRANRLRTELERRGVHAEALRFCHAEFLKENYFHTVLEASKSLADRLRQKSGLTSDGAELAQKALALGQSGLPVLAFNKLQTDTEKSEQKGLMNLFIGAFGAFRNVTAHEAKIFWNISEQDSLDYLTLVSMLHRRLDSAVRTTSGG